MPNLWSSFTGWSIPLHNLQLPRYHTNHQLANAKLPQPSLRLLSQPVSHLQAPFVAQSLISQGWRPSSYCVLVVMLSLESRGSPSLAWMWTESRRPKKVPRSEDWLYGYCTWLRQHPLVHSSIYSILFSVLLAAKADLLRSEAEETPPRVTSPTFQDLCLTGKMHFAVENSKFWPELLFFHHTQGSSRQLWLPLVNMLLHSSTCSSRLDSKFTMVFRTCQWTGRNSFSNSSRRHWIAARNTREVITCMTCSIPG